MGSVRARARVEKEERGGSSFTLYQENVGPMGSARFKINKILVIALWHHKVRLLMSCRQNKNEGGSLFVYKGTGEHATTPIENLSGKSH